MKEVKEKINQIYSRYEADMVTIRRHIHKYPELSFQEFETQKYIMSKLKEWGIEHYKVADTGVIGIIRGKKPESRWIVIRGDIDALPIYENTGLEFSSINEGVMHACGHDVHTTCILGAGRILNELKDDFEGSVKLLFQPGEEKLPGGATKVIASGELDNPKVDAIIGQHVFAELEVGKVGFRPGLYMASADEIYIDVKGPGGHAAMPEKTIDTLKAASQVILALKDFVDEKRPDDIPTVLTFGNIEGRGATNVIPKVVKIAGTLRTMDEEWRASLHENLERICTELSQRSGADIVIDIHKGYPCLMNHEKLTTNSRKGAEEFLGSEQVFDLDLRMTAEDFAFYTQHYNACFYRLGIKSPGKKAANLHSPEFVVDEKAISLGSRLMAFLAIKNLSSF